MVKEAEPLQKIVSFPSTLLIPVLYPVIQAYDKYRSGVFGAEAVDITMGIILYMILND